MGKKLSEKVIKMLDGKNFAHVATLMPDGSPQVSAVWIDREVDLIVFNTAVGRAKYRNLVKDKRIALSIADATNPYSEIWIRGKVVEITEEGADAHIDKLAQKYLGKEKYPMRQPGERRVIIRVEAEHINEGWR
ncbi:MAG: PPOX class F420-dependent oxidoreductase [Candidatus Micrarchaeota archaeon]|nr:PPOX class F420-dependent oxidoreductase [Candidatus Micrarchaeota archaeon]